jgi:hypothetical protein
MRRRLFNLLVVVTALLFLATVALWIDSHFKQYEVSWQRWAFNGDLAYARDDEITVRAHAGQILIEESFVQGDTSGWNTFYLKRYGPYQPVAKPQNQPLDITATIR